MCGFLVYKKSGNNNFISKRGQDHTNEYKKEGFTFVHNLLHITGQFTPQPYIDNNIVCLYNGEIYNHKFVRSDGENLIPLYKEHGPDFPKHLDGEWAIALYDFGKKMAIFASDLFATKPIWRNGLECASYASGVGGKKLPANTIEIIHFDGKEEKKPIHVWDLTQKKETYEDWIKAFEKAVEKRATPGCFLGISSGYDSGAIATALLKQGVDFKAYMVEGREDKAVLEKRISLLPNHEFIPRGTDFSEEQKWINTEIEQFDYIGGEGSLQNDKASLALAKICRLAYNEDRKVYLSGQGADEIISDYALYPKQSTFKGRFPDKLTLWENFYDGCQYNYLGKEEYVAGSFSIETRYPYLDETVVQEFLWLTPGLKNAHYKAPIYKYLTNENFPFAKDVKIGLRV